jgi:sec-independent protein translocase protein TatC
MPLDQIDVDQEEKKTGREMSFFDHLEELRWHILRSLAAISVFGITLFIYQEWMFKVLIFGPSRQDFITYTLLCSFSKSMGLGNTMCFAAHEVNLQTIGFAEPFVTSMWVSFVVGLIMAAPYVLWEVWRFVSPGLLPKEQKAATGAVFVCSFLFLLGVVFGYFLMAPFAINFLIGYTIPGVTNIPTLNSYINYMVMFTLPLGVVFELPVVVYFLARIGLITAADMRAFRRQAIVVILVVAGIITPPDVVSQMLVTIPLYTLYEVSIMIAKRVAPKDDDDDSSAEVTPS